MEIAIATSLRAGETDIQICKTLARDYGLSFSDAQEAVVRMTSSCVVAICGPLRRRDSLDNSAASRRERHLATLPNRGA